MGDISDGAAKKVRAVITCIIAVALVTTSVYTSMKMQEYSKSAADAEAINAAAMATVKTLMIKYNMTLKDPTERQLMMFLQDDTTNDSIYTKTFNCVNFSAMMMSHAIAAGWRCGLVQIWYESFYFFTGGGHVMLAFDVKTMGIVFIEPQSDNVMWPLKHGDNYLNGTVQDVNVYWFEGDP